MILQSTKARSESAKSQFVATRTAVRRSLLRWYDRHRRDLPWRRRQNDPYAQWVAEIMLQQTRVETVVCYYERFLRRFSTVESLAASSEEDVLKHWEGLGYYRRVLSLHNAAKEIAAHGGGLPETAEDWRRLSGVGVYTAAAISSIVFGEPVAAVDGNVARVIARLAGVSEDILTSHGKKRIGEEAQLLLAKRRPGDFNQAWMDLGSSVCRPRNPRCDRCPLKNVCVARLSGRTQELPVRGVGRRRIPREITSVVGLFLEDGKMLLRRRPTGGLWAGLWEFPQAQTVSKNVSGSLRKLAKANGLAIKRRPQAIGSVVHKLTHQTWTFCVYLVQVERGSAPQAGNRKTLRWIRPAELTRFAVSTAHRRIFSLIDGRIESA